MSEDKVYDIIIGGGGPVGLMLACEVGLAARGALSVLVLERDQDDDSNGEEASAWKTMPLGMRGLNTPSAEALYRRGLLADVIGVDEMGKRIEADTRPHDDVDARTGWGQFAGHFAGMLLAMPDVDFSKPCWRYKLPGPALYPSRASLDSFARALRPRAAALGVEVRGGVEVTGVTTTTTTTTTTGHEDEGGEGEGAAAAEDSSSSGSGSVVSVHTAAGETLRARWLVGCEGGRSPIRKSCGFGFAGTEAELLGYLALCDIDDPHGRVPRGFRRTPRGVTISIQPGHVILMDADPAVAAAHDRRSAVTLDQFNAMLRRVTGHDDVRVTKLRHVSSCTDRCMQATEYRRGRVLLAGDSAHIHSPLGGQGLNAGLGDAVNLGWKLAAVARGDSPPSLLDTYERERWPVGQWVLEWTRAQVLTMKADPHSRAITSVFERLIHTRDGTTDMVDKLWGLTQRYDLSSGGEGEETDGDNKAVVLHELVGRSAPEFAFTGGGAAAAPGEAPAAGAGAGAASSARRLGEVMRSGGGLLVDFGKTREDAAIDGLARRWEGRVQHLRESAKDQLGLRALLVRPDGTVAWVATDDDSEPDLAALEASLVRWFGPA